MQLCNSIECSIWLSANSTREFPYTLKLPAGTAYVQFSIYEPRRPGIEVLQMLGQTMHLSRQALLQVVDWFPYGEQTNASLLSLCSAFPQQNLDNFGILFNSSEQEALVSAAASIIDQQMSAYLYFPQTATCFLWEGDMVDFWSPHFDTANKLIACLGIANMKITSQART
jgi:hypothetical protein